MPTYEYECVKCRKTFEVFQSMKDPAFTVCPESQCRMKKWGKGKVRRLLGTGAGLIFKGSGFYITDYRSDGYKQAAKKEGSPASDAAKPAEKPAAETSQTRKISQRVKSNKCAQCGHENDVTRAYCQNCGAALELSAENGPKISGPTKVPAGVIRRRDRQARLGCAGATFWLIRRIFSTAILAALLAAGIQMARPPDGIPPAQRANEAQAGQLLQALQTLAASTYARAIDVTQAEANNYLAASIVPDPEATGKPLAGGLQPRLRGNKIRRIRFFCRTEISWMAHLHAPDCRSRAFGRENEFEGNRWRRGPNAV